jgi:hypothetical protein
VGLNLLLNAVIHAVVPHVVSRGLIGAVSQELIIIASAITITTRPPHATRHVVCIIIPILSLLIVIRHHPIWIFAWKKHNGCQGK